MTERPIKRMPVPTEALAKGIEDANNQITALQLQLAEINEKEKQDPHTNRKSYYRFLRLDLKGRIQTLEKQKDTFEGQLAKYTELQKRPKNDG